MTKLHDLARLGQSIWYDNIRRALLESGEFQQLLNDGVRGVTSNPSIFEKAIVGSADYDEAIQALVASGKSALEIYDALTLQDIARTADLLRPIYDETDGVDGYVSLEVSPTLAHDTTGTIAEAQRLFAALGRPNVMIKVPATAAGIPAIRALTGEGINVNATLVFSVDNYEEVAAAYISGLESHDGDLSRIASVASVFVSRLDTAVDDLLPVDSPLRGQIAIANAKHVYGSFRQIFSGPRWQALVERGARAQRPLWASTSVKNPSYPDAMYVDALIGNNTVNTVPPAALDAFQAHGTVAATLEAGWGEAQAQLADLGIDLDAVTEKLQADGVAAFAKAFESLLTGVAVKRDRLQAQAQPMETNLGAYQTAVDGALQEMQSQSVMERIWAHDHTVWRPEPTEITNRLGWLHIAGEMEREIGRLEALAADVKADGYTDVLLLGMGGSSMAPELFAKTFGAESDGLNLQVLDSTDADAARAQTERLDMAATLFIVATKSGGTVETLSFFKYFYNRVADALGEEQAGAHFVAITDPGSKLEAIGGQYNFRDTFLNNPNIGGRYSALSFFGLVPAALVGVDVAALLARAQKAAAAREMNAQLGAILGELAKAGRDKATFVISPPIESFGDWAEQLVAESVGKEGVGIVPVVGEPLGAPDVYGADRFFIYLRLAGDATHDAAFGALAAAGHPVVTLHLTDEYDLGGQFFLWEMATAVAGHRLNIQPFDQPNVEAAKILARKMVAEYMEKGALPSGESAEVTAVSLRDFMKQAQPGDYVALQAYIQPAPETDAALAALRLHLRDTYQLATTVGYGPRFLHSTGQLHKGDGGNGLFIQFTSDPLEDAPIPDEAGQPESTMTFGVLKMAQALGDARALLDAGRRIIRFHLDMDAVNGLRRLLA
ncbi:MAG: bifunctional transaldolase/phosoglucose isomerase [Chloroflexi bacterium]|nr:bifunctional transaldolase/phosoglucose isomerase [Chloroflexota bacterium]